VSTLRSDRFGHSNMLSFCAPLPRLGKSEWRAINGFRKHAYIADLPGLEQVHCDGIQMGRMGCCGRLTGVRGAESELQRLDLMRCQASGSRDSAGNVAVETWG
jgi:hypothetical protein